MSVLPLIILPSHPSGFIVPRDSCGGVGSPMACHMFRFFSSPGCGFIVIGYYVPAGMAEHMRATRTHIRWKGGMFLRKAQYAGARPFSVTHKVFAWIDTQKKLPSICCFCILIMVMLFCIFHCASCHFVLLVFPARTLTGDCHHSCLLASFLICFTYAAPFPFLFPPPSGKRGGRTFALFSITS